MKLLLILACALIVGLPFYKHEMTRWHHCLKDCQAQHAAHKHLLNSPVCTDPQSRLRYKLAGTVDCELAERETRLDERECASQMWRKQSEIVYLYNRLFGTYWKLIGVLAVICLCVVLPISIGSLYFWVQRVRDKQMMETQERMVDKLTGFSASQKHLALQGTGAPESLRSPLSLPQKSKRKRRRKRKKNNEKIMLL